MALRKAPVSIFFSKFFENNKILATRLVSQLTENFKLHSTDPLGAFGKVLLGKFKFGEILSTPLEPWL